VLCPAVHQVEDIIDSGHTLARLSKVLTGAGADSVKVVALLDKKGRRRVEFFPDYVGWEVSRLCPAVGVAWRQHCGSSCGMQAC
jgi:hypoxanthine-guanine phosphoribosyltransferase